MAKSPDAFRTISEVADWLGVQAHVLRFWESKFTQVKPVKRAGGRRYYRPSDMLLLGGIKKLLHEDGLTIKGVQKILREHGMSHVADLSQPLDDLTLAVLDSDTAPETARFTVAEPEPDTGVVLPFEDRASASKAAEAPEPTQAPEDNAPEPEIAQDPSGPGSETDEASPQADLPMMDAARAPETPETTEEESAGDAAAEDAQSDAVQGAARIEAGEISDEAPEAEEAGNLFADDPDDGDVPDAEAPMSMPSFRRHRTPETAEPPVPDAAADDGLPRTASEAEPTPEPAETHDLSSAEVDGPENAEPLYAEHTADTADAQDASQSDATAPKPRVVDIPPLRAEDEIPARPSVLSALHPPRRLSKRQADELRPLLARLARVHDSLAGDTHGKDGA
ncbi:MerR family transcriptional regulator [Sulfitobacter sp. D35]|uniref:MerR family transcriptional regulator n=1 Tax=Sulfitobacter sp. D35 TaxID=3083252 RepID=UPI00296EA50A|nr:MerR family transcriptional regulator [Sulfitobacter sp. D35]MDW4497583.1 MerR family transcriptional regulator [Sulfitobacter sp. D35]